jgi:O-antigen/teichoic acid export membrane protein
MKSARQIALQGIGLVTRKGFLALSFLLIARKFGPAQFGTFTYVFTWVYVFALFSSLGFSPVSTREVARDQAIAPEVLGCALIIRLIASAISVMLLLVVMFFSPMGRPELRSMVLVLAWTIPPLAVLDQLAAYVMGFGSNSRFAFINLVQWGSYFIATILGIIVGRGLQPVLAFQLIGVSCSLLICVFVFRTDLLAAFRRQFNMRLAKYLTREAAPLAMTNLLGVLYFRIGTLQLYHFLGPGSTGLYTSSLQVVEALQLIPMAITGAMFPLISRAIGNNSEFSRLFNRIVIVLVFFSLFIGATASTIGSSVMPLIFGKEYAGSGRLLSLLIWAATPTFLHYTFAYFLIAAHKQKLVTLNALLGVVISFTANLTLIPRYGVLGAVYGSLITETSICILHLSFLLPLVKVSRELNLLAIPAMGALLVVLTGFRWHEYINANLVNIALFSCFSSLLFATAFFVCRQFSEVVETA